MPVGSLTLRQQQVASLVYKGHSNRAISEALSISEETVKRHLCAILAVTACKTRAELLSQRIAMLEREVSRLEAIGGRLPPFERPMPSCEQSILRTSLR